MSGTQIGSGPLGQGPINPGAAGAAAPPTQARVYVVDEVVVALLSIADEAVVEEG
jgi:hypothetical protein